jgi:aminopeptidase N
LVTSDLTPNAIVSALAANFSLAQDPSVLEEFVADYFAMLEPMWQERTYKIAEYLAEGLYPSSLVSTSLVDATQSWLDTAPNIPALRRIVQENLAGVERALRVRALDS